MSPEPVASGSSVLRRFSQFINWSRLYITGIRGADQGSRRNSYGRWAMGAVVPNPEVAAQAAGVIWRAAKAHPDLPRHEEFFKKVKRWFPGSNPEGTAEEFAGLIRDLLAKVPRKRRPRRQRVDGPVKGVTVVGDLEEARGDDHCLQGGDRDKYPTHQGRPGSASQTESVQVLRDGPRSIRATTGKPGSCCGSWLSVPRIDWDRDRDGPGTLLRPESRVVPFHGKHRTAEILELSRWCHEGARVGFRAYEGPGGIGKTRLGLQLCDELTSAADGEWTAGFLNARLMPDTNDPWESLAVDGKSLLVVVDYAADPAKTDKIIHLLRSLDSCRAARIRMLFLEREHLWVGRLEGDPDARRALERARFQQEGFEVRLPPVAASVDERQISFRRAASEYVRRLDAREALSIGIDFTSSIYNQVLLLHMGALLQVLGQKVSNRTESILSGLLSRERAYWKRIARARGLELGLVPAVEQACHAITLNGGVATIEDGLALCRGESYLSDLPRATVRGIVELLRECYPAEGGAIGPLQPDLLAQELIGSTLRRPPRHGAKPSHS